MTDPLSPCSRCATHDYHQDSACSISPGETCQLHNQTFSGVLVHGTPLGHAGEVASIRYAHAWIELGTLLVVDLTMSGHPIMPRELYYRACGLDESHVKRYPRGEAYATLHAVRCRPQIRRLLFKEGH